MSDDDLIKRLHGDSLFIDALATVKDDAERKAIQLMAEKFVSEFASAIVSLLEEEPVTELFSGSYGSDPDSDR